MNPLLVREVQSPLISTPNEGVQTSLVRSLVALASIKAHPPPSIFLIETDIPVGKPAHIVGAGGYVQSARDSPSRFHTLR